MSWLGMTPLEIVSATVSLVGVWLTIRRSLLAWPIIILSCLLYGEFFREIHLFSDMALQGVFAVCAVYGWWKWQRGVRDDGAVVVVEIGWRSWVIGVGAGVLGSLLLGYYMVHFVTSASLPWLDASLTAFSLVGTVWQARKYFANWWIWIAVDVVYLPEYIYKGANVTAALYAVFVVLAVLGLRDWRRALRLQQEAASTQQLQAAR
jgi:nicotinamide mononucleotide transporter